jgi:hypothetical protein
MNSSGSILVCMSSVSVGVVQRAPLTARVAIYCALVSCHNILTDPVLHFTPGVFCSGLYQISALYIILGTATAVYSCCIILGEGLVSVFTSQ